MIRRITFFGSEYPMKLFILTVWKIRFKNGSGSAIFEVDFRTIGFKVSANMNQHVYVELLDN